jgi:type II secretory pathway pseudopilin PulG
VAIRSNRAFTLVEVLVSLLVAVTLLGASVGSGRAITSSLQTEQAQTEMGSLADEIVAQLQILQSENNDASLANVVGINTGSTPPIDSVMGTVVQSGSSASYLQLTWAQYMPGTGYASNAFANPVCPSPTACSTLATQYPISSNPPYTALYAVSRNSSGVSGATPLVVLGPNVAGSPTHILITSDYEKNWDFYKVVTIVSVVGAQAAAPGYSLDTGAGNQIGGASLTSLQDSTYQIQVKVTNYLNPQINLTRNVYVTDWQ